jgi:hypothetical protein
MPSKKTPPKLAAKRKHRAAHPKALKPSSPTPPSVARDSDAPSPSEESSRETGGGLPTGALLDVKRLLLQAKRYRLRRNERLGDAFRRIGLDENAIAAGYADALAKLQKGNADDAVEKSLLDILKECARILEPPRPADRSASIDVNTVVQLVHKVDRPLRSLPERATAVALVEASDPRAIVAEPPVTITEEPVAATDPNAEASPLPS